ncbi:protein RRP5 homolog [Anthonomus grandis grandis]|uniref:protein RRP5 homolog n=1 Tax=Anthonomus grandis grandis TaxID=2921223 RepID=UPI002166404D|nr:protein RRP5 homolog [Anthonomus grandis grandis]
MAEEESFPRGGKIVRKRPQYDNETLFSVSKPPKAKKPKKSKKKQLGTDETSEPVVSVKGTLSYQTIQTGMVILGCVRQIKNLAIEVELPGLCFATVGVTQISDSFTKYLNQQIKAGEIETNKILSMMFSVGEFLPVKIMNIESREKGTHLEGSINPLDIYSERNHDSFKKEMLVWASVSSKADHGYEMSLGVKNCRVFLPSKNINEGVNYVIGKPLWCVVHKFDATSTTSTVRLSAKYDHIRILKGDVDNLHNIIPGNKVEFLVDKITAHGLLGKFSENFVGYVDENYLKKPLNRPSDYHEGKLLAAYILYVEPITKITHLTLRPPEKEEEVDLPVGKVVQAEVFGKSNTGLYFALPDKQRGYAANKRLLRTLSRNENINISEAVASKYPLGSKHPCRIMDYNHLSKTFICSPEHSVVKENTFASTDLIPGQLTVVTVVNVKEEGIVVSTGHVRGFVPNLHISNIEYSSNVKKKFKVGQKVNARVLSAEEDKVLFTLKPALVENELCLKNIEDAEIGNKYPGVVSKVSENGTLVVFYGNVKGWISQKGMGNEQSAPAEYFFIGQVINPYIWKVDPPHMQLSLFKPQVKSALPNVGGRYVGIVRSVTEAGVNIKLENSATKGFIPNAHISCSLNLCQAVKKTIHPGDKISDLMYIGGVKPQIFSRREGQAIKTKLPSLEDLQVGKIIRCSYKTRSDDGIYVLPLIRNYTELTFIPKEALDDEMDQLIDYQLLLAKIKKLNLKNKEISLTVKLNDVFNKRVESVIDLFTQYLQEVSNLFLYAKKQKWGLSNYTPGQHVSCKVEKLGAAGGCVVSLPHGVKGIAVASLCPKTIKEGELISGTVIGHDYEKQYVDVCLKSDVASRINQIQDGQLNGTIASCLTEKLLQKDDYIISLLKHPDGNKQLIYLPIKLHENDLKGSLSYYDNKKFKVCVCGKMKRFLIGLSKKLFLHLDKSCNKHKQVIAQGEEQTLTKISKKEKPRRPDRKRKVEQIEEVAEVPVSSERDSGIENSETDEDHMVDVECDITEETIPGKTEDSPKTCVKEKSGNISLPGISMFFNPEKNVEEEESSSDEETTGPTVKKRKKLSPAERAELLRQEEERVLKIERELTDPTRTPESAEQFDRLLLSKPDSAELWTKYIAFYIAATEIDKARAVARRALTTINMTLTDEKFKIWIVLLNLENMFGTKESFDSVLDEALKFNDSLQVYLKVIQMLAESAKYNEMEEKIIKARAKHRQDPTMWLEIGKTYYLIGKFNEARNCKDRALKSITDKKSQMNIIVRFAIMEFKHGEPEQGCAIFETILTSDPKKVNIWVTYVDQLVKKDRIDEARQVLERAASHKLPLKCMKSLLLKFKKFEEEFGTPETVEAVKQRAQDYVNKVGK